MTAALYNKISKTSKLGTLSWSLQALETCPGSLSEIGRAHV